MNFMERHPMVSLFLVFVLCFTALNALNDTATIETIDGKQYVTAINGKDIDPRRPNRYDIEFNWEYK